MRYCANCGHEVNENAAVCLNCGAALGKAEAAAKDSSSFGYGLLGFFVPVAGFILWLMWRDDTPLRARSAGLGALISTIVNVVFSIAFTVFYFVFIAAIMSGGF